jgi:UDP-glucose 4-epimerase
MVSVGLNKLQGIFNVGTGEGTSIKKLIENIQTISGKEFEIIHKPRRLIDSLYNVLDNTKLIRSVKWSPSTYLVKGITQLLKESNENSFSS